MKKFGLGYGVSQQGVFIGIEPSELTCDSTFITCDNSEVRVDFDQINSTMELLYDIVID